LVAADTKNLADHRLLPGNNETVLGTLIKAEHAKPDLRWNSLAIAVWSSYPHSLDLTIMTSKRRTIRFPIWKFLNQPLFDPQMPVVLDPGLFWRLYQVQYLRRCWDSNYRPEKRSHN
jgi:hypothetical protein